MESEFPYAIGQADPFLYPTTHDQAQQALQVFLKDKFAWFEDYLDAIQKENSFL